MIYSRWRIPQIDLFTSHQSKLVPDDIINRFEGFSGDAHHCFQQTVEVQVGVGILTQSPLEPEPIVRRLHFGSYRLGKSILESRSEEQNFKGANSHKQLVVFHRYVN